MTTKQIKPSVQISTRVSRRVFDILAKKAAKERRSMSNLLAMIVEGSVSGAKDGEA
jgi:hypothetical protein